MKLLPFPAGAAASADDPDAGPPSGDCAAAVTALYREHALGFIRLAYVTQGSRAAAEDIVQEAFSSPFARPALSTSRSRPALSTSR